jgi:hypothetical protein
LPTGLLQTVDELACNAVKEEPAVRTPESAAALPTEKTGVVPVFVVVTASKLHAASTSGTGGLKRLSGSMKLFLTIVPELPALSWTCLTLPVETASADRLGKTASAIAKHANKAAALKEIYLDRNVLWGTRLDMDVPFTKQIGRYVFC